MRRGMICLVLALALAGAAAAQNNPTAQTTAIAAVYAAPGGSEEAIAELPAQRRVVLEGRSANGAWLLVHTPDGSVHGWVETQLLETDASVAGLPVVSGAGGFQLYERPDPASPVLAALSPETRVTIQGRNFAGSWLLVHTAEGGRGWVEARHIALDAGLALADLPVMNTAPAGDRLVLRAGPGEMYPTLAALEEGALLTMEGRDVAGRWFLAQSGETRGWIAAHHLALDAAALNSMPVLSTSRELGTSTMRAGDVALHAAPGSDALVEAVVPAGMRLMVAGRDETGQWLVMHTPDYVVKGWVMAADITLDPRVTVEALPVMEENFNLRTGLSDPRPIPEALWVLWDEFVPPSASSRADWHAEYYNGSYNPEEGYYYGLSLEQLLDPYLWGEPAAVRSEEEINYNWGYGVPVEPLAPPAPYDAMPWPANVQKGGWAARWTTTQYFDYGEWYFVVRADDGVRLWIDDKLIIDSWQVQDIQNYQWHIWLEAGEHTIRMDSFEYEGVAVAKLAWWMVNTRHAFNVQFDVDRPVINEGECVTVSWKVPEPLVQPPFAAYVSHYDRVQQVYTVDKPPVVLYNGNNAGGLMGEVQECPRHTAHYSLSVSYNDAWGNPDDAFPIYEEFYRLWVDVIPDPDPFHIDFNVDRTEIRQGECVTFTWGTKNARRVYFDDVRVDPAGSSIRCPGDTTTYELRVVRNDWNIDTPAHTIAVVP